MTYRKLNLDRDKIDHCRNIAERIVAPVTRYIERHSTTRIEKACLRVMGASESHANTFVEGLTRDQLRRGAAWWFVNAKTGAPEEKTRATATGLAKRGIAKIEGVRNARENLRRRFPEGTGPLKYAVIGSLSPESVCRAVECGADIVAFAGFCTKTDLGYLRKILDESHDKAGKYIRMALPISAPCIPEEAVWAALQGADMFVGDPLSDILQNETSPKSSFVDWHFAYLISARSSAVAGTGDANLPAAHCAYRDAHEDLIRLFINEDLARRAGISPEGISFTHSFDIVPEMEDSFLHALAHAQMVREIFPRSPLRYAQIGHENVSNVLFNVACVITEQSMQSVGTDKDCDLAFKDTSFIFRALRHIGDEITFIPNGKITRRAHTVLENAHKHMRKMELMGLMQAMGKGLLMNVQSDENSGKGLEGVFQKDRNYFNPVMDILKSGEEIGPAEIQALSIEDAPDVKEPLAPVATTLGPGALHKKRRRGRRGGRRHRRKPAAAVSK